MYGIVIYHYIYIIPSLSGINPQAISSSCGIIECCELDPAKPLVGFVFSLANAGAPLQK
jgi:hypothetical protein